MSAAYDQAARRVRETLGVESLPTRGTGEYVQFLADLGRTHPAYARLLSEAELNEDETPDEEPRGKPNAATKLRLLTDRLKRRAMWRESAGGAWVLNKSRGMLVLALIGFAAFGTYAAWYYTRPIKGGGALISGSSGTVSGEQAQVPVGEPEGRLTADASLPPDGAAPGDAPVVPIKSTPIPTPAPDASNTPLMPPPAPPPAFTQPPYRPASQDIPLSPPVRLPTVSPPPATPFPAASGAPDLAGRAPSLAPASPPKTVTITAPDRASRVQAGQGNVQGDVFGADGSDVRYARPDDQPNANAKVADNAPETPVLYANVHQPSAAQQPESASPVLYVNAGGRTAIPSAAAETAARQDTSPILYMGTSVPASVQTGQDTAAQPGSADLTYLRPPARPEGQAPGALLYSRNGAAGNVSPAADAPPLPTSITAPAAPAPAPTDVGQQSANQAGHGSAPSAPPLPNQAGQLVQARLVTAVETYEGRPVPVIAESSEGNWVGLATVNPAFGRVEVQFTRLIKDGQTYAVNGVAFDPGYTQGLGATIRDTSPALAQDLARAGVSSLNTYAQSLLGSGTTTFGGGIGVTTKNAAPLSAIVSGELGKVFQLPQNNQSFLRVARVERGTPFLIALGLTGEER